MTFASPPLLAGLLLVPLLIAAYVVFERRRRTPVAAPLLPAVVPRRAGWRRHVPIAAGLGAIALLLTELAKPQTTVAVPVERARVVVMVDRSGSMQASDVAPNRLTAARKAAETFLNSVPAKVRVGAIAFNQVPTVLQSPTDDHDAVKAAIESIKPAGGTATGDALAAALKSLRGDSSPAAIVLLSDGKSVKGQDVLAVARQAKAAKIPVYTVSLGTADGTITTKSGTQAVPPDPATMKQVAAITGGESYAVSDAKALSAVYEKLGSKVATAHKKEDMSPELAGGALFVLFAGALGSVALTGRVV